MRWTGAIELFHQSQLTLMDYKLSNVDDKHRPCFTSISSKGLANGYIGYFVGRIAFLIRIRSKKLRDVVGLRTEFFQFDTCGCQITRAPYQKEAQICKYLFLVIFSQILCCFWFLSILFPSLLVTLEIAIVYSEVKFACWNKWRFFGYNSKASCDETGFVLYGVTYC